MTKTNDGAIKPRRMQFNTDDIKMAQFAIFPEGERFFIPAVRHYQKSVEDPKMLADIRGFIGQEA